MRERSSGNAPSKTSLSSCSDRPCWRSSARGRRRARPGKRSNGASRRCAESRSPALHVDASTKALRSRWCLSLEVSPHRIDESPQTGTGQLLPLMPASAPSRSRTLESNPTCESSLHHPVERERRVSTSSALRLSSRSAADRRLRRTRGVPRRLDGPRRTCKSRRVKSCGPSGSQDLAFKGRRDPSTDVVCPCRGRSPGLEARAAGVGFEPTRRLHAQRFSRPPRSTAPAPRRPTL